MTVMLPSTSLLVDTQVDSFVNGADVDMQGQVNNLRLGWGLEGGEKGEGEFLFNNRNLHFFYLVLPSGSSVSLRFFKWLQNLLRTEGFGSLKPVDLELLPTCISRS